MLDYIGTLPEGPNVTNPNPALWTVSANPQSRYQVTENIANQTEATYKFNTFGWKHTALGGVEISREIASIDSYVGPEFGALPGGIPGGNVDRRQYLQPAIHLR